MGARPSPSSFPRTRLASSGWTPADACSSATNPTSKGSSTSTSSRIGRSPLLALAGLSAVAVVALGGWKGATALVGLLATLLVLFLFIVPAILDGRDPLLVSLVGSVAIAFAALYLSHGLDVKTTVALLGTLGGLVSPGGVYVNNLGDEEPEEELKAAYGSNYDRLVAMKNKYDPTNLFHLNQNIKPIVST